MTEVFVDYGKTHPALEIVTCPMCGTKQPVYLGTLGGRYVLRCRACAWTFNLPVDDVHEEGDDDGTDQGD